MNVKLVGVTLDELEIALKHSGLVLRGTEIHEIPSFIRSADKPYTTLDLWEKLGEHQERIEKIKEALK